jgi:glutaminyl-peptide cyclotransferase
MDPTPTVLSTIEHLVLLDLLGSPAPRIMQWYRETGWLFDEMKRADERLRKGGVVKSIGGAIGGEWFSPLSFQGTIEDDQVPVSPGVGSVVDGADGCGSSSREGSMCCM